MSYKLLFFTNFFSLIFLISCDSSINKINQSAETSRYSYDKLSCSAFQSPCYIENVVGRFDVYFLSDELRAEEPFRVAVQYRPHQELNHTYNTDKQIDTSLENLQLITLSGYMEGKDMFMGKIPVSFEKSQKLFVANAMVSACHTSEMVWQLILTAELEDSAKKQIKTLPFAIEFVARR